jgi:molybdopterin-guanine dinucleotide biosynthesis protein A
MRGGMADAIVLLAGGAASRFPGKLDRPLRGKPLIAHVFDNLQGRGWAIYIAASRSFPVAIAMAFGVPVLYDRAPSRGPLWALVDASAQIDAERIFAVAGDQPQIDATVLERLAAVWEPGDEAVVPQHAGGIEPLGALYDRGALQRAVGSPGGKRGSMRDFLHTLRVRYEPMDARYFVNVNTSADFERLNVQARHASATA